MGALLTVALVAGEEHLVDSLAELGLIEVWTEIGFNVGAGNILIPLTDTSVYVITEGGYAAAGIAASTTIGSSLAGGIVKYMTKSALKAAINQGSLRFWANIHSRKPIKSPHLIQDIIHETLQEISQQIGLECFRCNKQRNQSTE
ncbi:hypothetical protein AVEN_146940-1 [Araneus ventricosus]|uniref:Uncharacterized protein n=1 Tax=Araneus ventricosus TaxID=182803 RepID=A0A4Y2M203_ARAVE|nr:hypothetical protein AVEN_146940-1 [Araneus ventricosus]